MTDLSQQNSSNDIALPDQTVTVMTGITAEVLLQNSMSLAQVNDLRQKLTRTSDGTIVNYDEIGHRLQDEILSLPVLELQQNIAPGTEGAYQRQLLHALEKINDDHDRVMHKLLKVKSRLVNAINLMKVQKAQFVAFYSLAFNSFILSLPKHERPKFTVKQVEAMGEGEFSRLMNGFDGDAPSIISELEILEMEIKTRKKSQAAKYQLGKDQVNTLWTSFQSQGAVGLDDDPNALLKQFPVDDDGDEVPSFVSRHNKEVRVAASSAYVEPPTTLCSVCGEKQIDSPSGITCINGHGGAPGGVLSDKAIAERAAEPDIKGIFVKHGDPKPITAVEDDGGPVVITKNKGTITLPQWSNERLRKLAEEDDAALAGRPEPMPESVVVKLDTPVEYVNVTVQLEEKELEVKEYRPKFNLTDVVDTMLNPTKRLEIEDIADYPPQTQQEALEIMEKETIREPERQPEFKPIPAKAFVLPEGATPVEDIEGILNDPEPLATVALSTPRKRLMLLDEDEL